MMKLLGSASMAALVCGAAWAQGAPEPTAEAAEATVETIIVRTSPLQLEQSEVIQGVSVIQRDEILEGSLGGIGDVLADLPGVSTTFFGQAANRPIIRGLDGERVRVLVNGVATLDVATQSPDHAVGSEVTEAEAIEVIRGPAAIAFGSGSIGGVVNVIDGRVPSSKPDGLFDADLVAGFTSVDEGNQVAGRFRTGYGNLVFQLDGARREADNFSINGFALSDTEIAEATAEALANGDEPPEFAEDFVPNSDFNFETLSGGLSWVDDWGFVGIAYKTTDADYGLPGPGEGEEEEEEEEEGPIIFPEGPRLDLIQNRVDFLGEVNADLGLFEKVRWSAAWADYEHEEIEPNGEVASFFENDGFEGRLELTQKKLGVLEGVIGANGFRQDISAIGEESFIPPSVQSLWGIFAVERADFGDLEFEGSARFERVTSESVSFGGVDADFNLFSVSGAAQYHVNESVNLGLTVSRTERAPGIAELFSDGVHLATQSFDIGDPTLEREAAIHIEGSVGISRQNWTATVNAFRTGFDGFIGFIPTDEEEDGLTVFNYVQDDAQLFGFEGVVEGILANFGAVNLEGDAQFEFVRGEFETLGNLPRIPPLQVGGGLTLTHSFADFGVNGQWTTNQANVSEAETPTEGFFVFNTELVLRPDERVRFVVEGQNLTNADGRLVTSFINQFAPIPGRGVRLNLVLDF
ncbi:MAG: TonB-dependent receptor [Maricaulaceae bacterium]